MDHDVMYLQGQQQQQQEPQQQLVQQHLLQQLLHRQQLQQQQQQQPQQQQPHHQQQQEQIRLPTSQPQQPQQQKPVRRRTTHTPDGGKKNSKLCAVCSELAAGKYFGAEVCVPCKTFYLRYAYTGDSFTCKGNDNCLITSTQRTCCKKCRFRKCREAGMERKLRPMNVPLKEGQQKCVVCSDVANGIHFGALTCEGCKKFFRRGMNESHTYVCKNSKSCVINPRTRNACRYCRYQKCLAQKMSREAIQMGRPSKMTVTTVMSSSHKKEKSPGAMVAHGHHHHHHQHQQQQQHHQSHAFHQPSSHALMGLGTSQHGGGYYMGHHMVQMAGAAAGGGGVVASDHHHDYLAEMQHVQNMKIDHIGQAFSKYAAGSGGGEGGMDISPGRSAVGYQGLSPRLNQPINYMMEEKQQAKSFYGSNGMNGGSSFSSAGQWHGDLNPAVRQRQPSNYCDTKVKMEQESAGLFYYLSHHHHHHHHQQQQQGSSSNGMPGPFEAPPLEWSDVMAYRQGDVVLQDFVQPLQSSTSPSSMPDEIFSDENVGGNSQLQSTDSSINHMGLFPFENGLENYAGNFDSIQNLPAFPSHVPSSGNVLDLKMMASSQSSHQMQNYQELFNSSGMVMSGQVSQEAMQSPNKHGASFASAAACSLESLMKNAESFVQEASLNPVDSKLKWSMTLQEANKQFRPSRVVDSFLEDDVSKAETEFQVEDGCFEDGSPYDALATASRHHWKSLVLPKPDSQWMIEYNTLCCGIVVPYKHFVSEMTILNQRLSVEFKNWLSSEKSSQGVSEFVEKTVVPEYAKLSAAYMKAIPGFLLLDYEDQKLLLRLAQCPSRILAGSMNWFDHANNRFIPEFLPWMRMQENSGPFFARLEQFARKMQRVRLDDTEECFLNAVVIISADYPNLKNPESIKETSMKFLKVFRAYTTLRSMRGSENTRLEFILSYVPELRHIGLLHHMGTARPNVVARSPNGPSSSSPPSGSRQQSNLETLQDMLLNGVDSRVTSTTVKDKSAGTGVASGGGSSSPSAQRTLL